MTRVDFYELASSAPEARLLFACRLTEKALSAGNSVLLRTQDKTMSEALSETLWSFRPEAFIPHTIEGLENTQVEQRNEANTPPKTKVIIKHDDHVQVDRKVQLDRNAQTNGNVQADRDMLINLSNVLPKNHTQFTRIAEIIINQAQVLTSTRAHWQAYKSQGYTLNHHKV